MNNIDKIKQLDAAFIRGIEADLAAVTAQVTAVNLANDCANKVYEELTRFFTPYVGKKILKSDGSFIANIKLPYLPNNGNVKVYRLNHIRNFLAWEVSASMPNCGITYEVDVFIGAYGSGEFQLFLDSISPPLGRWRRTDYTVEEVFEKRKRYQDAERVCAEALSELSPFGKHHR